MVLSIKQGRWAILCEDNMCWHCAQKEIHVRITLKDMKHFRFHSLSTRFARNLYGLPTDCAEVKDTNVLTPNWIDEKFLIHIHENNSTFPCSVGARFGKSTLQDDEKSKMS